MAGSLNKALLIGNLTRDPECRSFQNGGKICTLRIATNESWRDKNSGERKERAEFHTVTIHNEVLVRVAEQYLRKGSKVYIEGKLETRTWQDQSGQARYSTEVTLRPFGGELVMLDGPRNDNQQQEQGYGGYDQSPEGYRGTTGSQPPRGDTGFDDEIPF